MQSPSRDLSPKRREVESAISELSLSDSESSSSGESILLSQKSTRQLHKLQRKINQVLAARASPSSSESEAEFRSLSSEEESEENQVDEAIRVKLTKIPPHLIMGDEVIGYKMVNLTSDSFDMKPIQVMLRIRIPFTEASIYNVEGQGQVMRPADLQKQKKYCTNIAFVDGLRVGGPHPTTVKKALMALQTNNASMVSKADRSFEYKLQQFVSEPRAGRNCGNGNCGSGIYFYLDPDSSFGYFHKHCQGDYYITGVVDKALLFDSRPASEEAKEKEILEEARQHRTRDLQQWAKGQFGFAEAIKIVD